MEGHLSVQPPLEHVVLQNIPLQYMTHFPPGQDKEHDLAVHVTGLQFPWAQLIAHFSLASHRKLHLPENEPRRKGN